MNRIIFTGGGTLGSVTPLLAFYEEHVRDHPSVRALWIGTRQGPEWRLVEKYRIKGRKIYTGKIRRYFSVRNFLDPFLLFIGCLQSLYHIMMFRPSLIVNAGSYVGVPVVWAAWLVGVPVVLLQLDIRPSLSNMITSFAAKYIFASCDEAAKRLPRTKTSVTGIPIRSDLKQAQAMRSSSVRSRAIREKFGIMDDKPSILISGGGTGAVFLNILGRDLAFRNDGAYHIIAITGSGKFESSETLPSHYHPFPFLEELFPLALSVCDIVISRAGMGTISELAYLAKPTILIPIPESHQRDNAAYCESKNAAIHIAQEHATSERINAIVIDLLSDQKHRASLSNHIHTLFPSQDTFTHTIRRLLANS